MARKSNLIKVHFKKHVQITFKTQLLELLFKITLETLLFVYAATAGWYLSTKQVKNRK